MAGTGVPVVSRDAVIRHVRVYCCHTCLFALHCPSRTAAQAVQVPIAMAWSGCAG